MAYKSNATEEVYNFVCDKIRTKEWKQGDRIWTEQKIGDELGVSRVAVRQALDKLATASIVKKIQGSGTYVQESNPITLITVPTYEMKDEDLIQIMYFRIYFEPGNVELFIKNADDKYYEQLTEIHERLMSCDKNSEQFFKYDFEFHRIISDGTKNIFIRRTCELLMETLIQNQEHIYRVLGPNTALEYHPLIYKYIMARDTQAAALMMRRHMEESVKLYEQVISPNK